MGPMTKSDKNMGLVKDKHKPEPAKVATGKRKNTRKWCKGVVGREHQLERQPNRHLAYAAKECGVLSWWPGHWYCREIERCSVCGKITRWLDENECSFRKDQAC